MWSKLVEVILSAIPEAFFRSTYDVLSNETTVHGFGVGWIGYHIQLAFSENNDATKRIFVVVEVKLSCISYRPTIMSLLELHEATATALFNAGAHDTLAALYPRSIGLNECKSHTTSDILRNGLDCSKSSLLNLEVVNFG